ncbi:uncharacterized protein HMPREF1541_04116 [Cyphellophora europaea CBS 101466]|uniref:Trichothecene 3-O-acetyltransferase n=1 Tax=Cyphellophora europaea (strain CBS 101466) TaxID=1220924 RepID=W2S0R0_CYPE1|nr:uncharacterized protein HMPREF1541_04116 [Cyphellophora europaea CBS 101466]ETN42175.1 hypothetical protein HMPREF1541_04116 [Cyphellophora europaea CBS 101466]
MGDQGNTSDLVRPTDYGFPQVSAKQALTPLDMNMPRLYGTRWILCFPLEPNAAKQEVYNELKAGLAKTISEIPWTAGVVGPETGSEPDHSRIEVADGNNGVLFKYNDLTASTAQHPSYEELKTAQFPLSKFSTAQLSPLGVMPDREPAPAMAAQANFIQGGLLLTICAHHSVCDAAGLNTVLQTWAQMSSAIASGLSFDKVDPAFHDRTRLMTGIPGAALADFPEYVLAPTPPAASTDVNTHQMAATPFQMPDMAARIFFFTPSSLTALKTAAAAYSSNDALHALVWRHVTLARLAARGRADPNDIAEGVTALLFSSNIRSKLSPPLPHNYTGNASVGSITRHLSYTELCGGGGSDGLATAAAALRSAVNGLNTPDRVALTIGLIASRPNPTDHKFAYNGFLGPDLSSTTWADLDVYDTVWGSLGTPDAFRIPGEGADGAMMVLPRVRGGGLEVVVALESRAMACLLADEEFLSWAEVRL